MPLIYLELAPKVLPWPLSYFLVVLNKGSIHYTTLSTFLCAFEFRTQGLLLQKEEGELRNVLKHVRAEDTLPWNVCHAAIPF